MLSPRLVAFVAAAAFFAAGCATIGKRPYATVNVVVWNQTPAGHEVTLVVDGLVVMNRERLDVAASPTMIVARRTLSLVRGRHRIRVESPRLRGADVAIVVREATNLHITLNADEIGVATTYGSEAYI